MYRFEFKNKNVYTNLFRYIKKIEMEKSYCITFYIVSLLLLSLRTYKGMYDI